MKTNKANENEHPVSTILRNWTKNKKANSPVVAERKEVYHDQTGKNHHRNP